MQRSRRRHRCGAQICAVIAAILLLLSVSLLYSRINFFHSQSAHSISQHDALSLNNNPLLDDSADSLDHSARSDDLIDEQDDFVPTEDEDGDGDGEDDDDTASDRNGKSSSLYFFDHQSGVVRRGFSKRTIDEWEDYVSFGAKLGVELGFSKEGWKGAFGSDDLPVDEETRKHLAEIGEVEDALLLKGSKLREGWGDWFDKKTDFLRRDRMFKSNMEGVNPSNNALLQDPDMPGITGLTRGDRVVQKGVWNDFKKVPFLSKKPLAVEEEPENVVVVKAKKRKTLNTAVSDIRKRDSKVLGLSKRNIDSEFSGLVFADGKRWGYYPGLESRLSFNNFMDAFFRKGKCSMRVFMVWNSAPWMFGVRHQRGLESLFFHHRDACVVVFSETLELNYFSSFVKDGYKVAVVMPNLDELLRDTPTHIFASAWHEWKKTRYYPLHYSELIRLAALYKYGGIYLDSDIVVLKPLSSLDSAVGMEDEKSLNGAVMAFRKHSPFLLECLSEFYASYDDTLLRWNGADLLARVARNFSFSENHSEVMMELRLQPSFVFFPIARSSITRYFSAPETVAERAEQDLFLSKIMNKSATVHFWNSLTSSLIPDPESLISRLINQPCIRCSDVL